ncbi:MAG TPA: hypothetical protein VFC63_03905 [Blastocatellia bacterium]|nr:hypothetical protein [Blastocatellia bacterium]
MYWPSPQDYNEALQHPRSSFADPELKQGEATLTALGLPRPITGAFASVYRMECGGRDWAVRCFLREFSDQSQRYAAISRHLTAAKLPYTVGFDFQKEGIKLNRRWYPILKMEWIEGDLLIDYVRKHLNKPASLARLASRWVAMARALNAAGVAHGDLQSGNVLVVRGELKLIDYDGMYVPTMAGQKSHEIGHRHFQHPKRTLGHFGPGLDNFSSWAIYLSLIALSRDSSFWKKTNAGDESLLFQESDFKNPTSSATFRLLASHQDPDIQELTKTFQSFLALPPLQVPVVENRKLNNRRRPRIFYFGSLRVAQRFRQITDLISAKRDVQDQSALSTQSHLRSSSWIQDWLPTNPDATTTPSAEPGAHSRFLMIPALILLTLSLVVVASLAFSSTNILTGIITSGGLFACAVALSLASYLFDPVSVHRRHLRKETRDFGRSALLLEAKINRIERLKNVRIRQHTRKIAKLEIIQKQIVLESQQVYQCIEQIRDRHLAAIKPVSDLANCLQKKPHSRNWWFSLKQYIESIRQARSLRKQLRIKNGAERTRTAIALNYAAQERRFFSSKASLIAEFDTAEFDIEIGKLRAEVARIRREIAIKGVALNDFSGVSYASYLISTVRSVRGKSRGRRNWSVG